MSVGWGAGVLFVLAGAVWLCSARIRVRPGVVLAVALLLRLPFFFVDLHGTDVYRYVWEGRIQNHGYSPYEYAAEDEALAHLRRATHDNINHPDLPTIYPPLAQLTFRAATGLGLREVGLTRLILLLDLCVVALLFLWLRSPRVLLYAWCPLAVAGAAGGHVDPLMLVFLVGCAWAWERRRVQLAAVLLGLAILSKGVAVLLIPWMLIRKPRAALAALLVVCAGYLPYGFALGSLPVFAAQFRFNGSLHHLLGPWTLLPLLFWSVWVTATQPRIAAAGALLFAGLLVCSPTVHFWYLLWFLVLLPAVGRRPWTAPLLLWCVTVTATYLTYALTPPFREFYALTALEYALPGLLALWLLWRGWPRRVKPAKPQAGVEGTEPLEYGVVIPCRGEIENLRALLPRWTAAARVVVADTPTGDGTRELCEALDPHIEYLEVSERGYGAAVQAGLRQLERGVAVAVVCDADHKAGPDQVDALLAPFRDERVGLVTAVRSDTPLPFFQRFGNGLVTFLIALGWRRRFHDLGPFRALRRPFLEIEDRGYGWNVEMNVRALEHGMRVVEVALPASAREFGANLISGTWRGVTGAGAGMLRRLYRLREQSCSPRS